MRQKFTGNSMLLSFMKRLQQLLWRRMQNRPEIPNMAAEGRWLVLHLTGMMVNGDDGNVKVFYGDGHTTR